MLLDVRHLTEYHYAGLVRESVMEVWMQPQKSAGQRLVAFDLELNPAAQLFSYGDAFGNAVYHFDVPQPHRTLSITAHSTVETQVPEVLPQAVDMGEWGRLRGDFVRGEYFDFLHHHGFAIETQALAEFVREHGIDRLPSQDPLTAVRTLSQVIYQAFGYEAGLTDAESPIDLALSLKRGVCQDFSHIMIAICRAWGIPARYVSGYLFTDRQAGDRSDPEATHAWVEVFLPTTRWIGLDPTNNVMAGERHIACAVGRDYDDVPPSRGVYKGDCDSQLAVAVAVGRTSSAHSEPEFMRAAQPTFSRASGRRIYGPQLDVQQQQQQQQ